MKLLLDTCAFIWLSLKPEMLSEAARQAFLDPDNSVFLSSVSALEIAHKHHIGKLPLPAQPSVFIPRERESMGIEALPFFEKDCRHYERLPLLHKDPFDRLLVCQALENGCPILTPDPLIKQYAVPVVW